MPLIPVNPNEKEWRYGVTVIGKIGKPGAKPVVHGNGRISLQFTTRIPCGLPVAERFVKALEYSDLNFRCTWLDPDLMLYTSDIVRVSGLVSRVGNDFGLLVNKCEVVARFVKKGTTTP